MKIMTNVSELPERERMKIAQSVDTSVETLKELAKDEDWGVRRADAENPKTPEETLSTLSHDVVLWVRAAAASDGKLRKILKLR